MLGLIRVELTRLRWRRAVLLLLAAAVLIPTVIFGGIAYDTRPVSASDLENAQAQADAEVDDKFTQQELERCLRKPGQDGRQGDRELQELCETRVLPQAEWFLDRNTLDLGSQRSETGLALVAILSILLLLIGTTFAGHDWNTGSMSNQVLFRPRRLQIWAAKAAAVLLVGLVTAGVVTVAYWGALIGLAQMRDIELIDGQVARIAGQVGRGTLLAAFSGVGGYALTMLSRSTVVAIGALFVASVAGPILLAVLSFPGSLALMPQNNVAAVILDGVEVRDYGGDACFDERTGRETPNAPGCITRISTVDGALYFGGLFVLVAVPSVWSFRRRDVP